jgi:hypothetical protein
MTNPTIYRYPRQIIRNPDDTITEVERTLRQNGDVSIIVKVKDTTGRHLVVYHLVYDSNGKLVHGPHEISGSRDPTYNQPFPPGIGRQP